jgi:hypothetical protein
MNIEIVTTLGDVSAKKDDMVEATEGGTAVRERKAIMESDIGTDIGGVVGVATTDDGPQLPSSPHRVPFGAPSHIDADYAAQGPEQGKNAKLCPEGFIDNSTSGKMKDREGKVRESTKEHVHVERTEELQVEAQDRKDDESAKLNIMGPLADALTTGEREVIETHTNADVETGLVIPKNDNTSVLDGDMSTREEESNEEVGTRIGEQLMQTVKKRKRGHNGESKVKVVKDFISSNQALGELIEQNNFVGTMLCAVVRNNLKRDAAKEGLNENGEEAKGWKIGSDLTKTMSVTMSAEEAIRVWAEKHSEVQEVMREHGWLRPMLEAVVKELFLKTNFGLKARVMTGAVLSMTDLVTDVYVTYMFRRGQKYGYFKASLASLAVSIGIQMLVVWGQNRKLGMKRVVREWIPILLGYKPAVDAYRVATGAKQEVGAVYDPMNELTCMKCSEMFAEAIPGVITQLMAIATSDKDVGTSAWLSVAVSAITTGFASATISYDWDTDPFNRENAPDFYGYTPAKASKRTVVFVSTLLFTAGMLLIRCTTIVLLGLIGGSWAFLYIGADLGLYILVKILRGDFWYWLPVGGNMEIVTSIIGRVIVKIIVDFTSMVHFRHPNEVGGTYWLFGLVLTMVSLPVSIYIYLFSPYADDNPIHFASFIVKYIIPITTTCLAVFFFNIESKYLHTFWSTQRSKDMSMAYFLEGESDNIKIEVFKRSKHHWILIEGEIKKWVGLNWAKWEEEQPEWLTDVIKAAVPVDFIPTKGDARRIESVRRASVDVEAEGGLAGALRASIRRASFGGADGGDIIGVGGGKAKVSSVVPIEDEDGE